MMPLIPAALAAVLAVAAPSTGPTLAVEDTMHTEVAPVLVRAPRVTLAEILDRVARGEARRDSLMRDQSFLLTMRLLSGTAETARPPLLLQETVARVYKRKHPDESRTQLLRSYQAKSKKPGKVTFNVSVGPNMNEDIVNFAFQPEARRDFRYRILGRDVAGNHLIYRIGFEPRSLLDPSMPRGTVWIDTNDFVIVRQEVGFDRSPAPPLIKNIDRMVIERENLDGYWVLRRVLMRAESSVPLPHLGRSFDMSLQFDQYAINTGLPDSLFVRSGRATTAQVKP
jgi:hypothetical protein